MHTFVINLDKDTERMDALHKHLVKCGLEDDYERISASTGYESDMPNWMEHACPSNVNGCFASHRRCWKEIVDRNLDMALILEDDVRFTDDAPKVLKAALESLPSDFDILYLGCFGECGEKVSTISHVKLLHSVIGFRKVRHSQRKDSSNLKVPIAPYGLHAYIITRICAQKLLEQENIPGICHVDMFIGKIDNLAVYSCDPVIAYQARAEYRSHNLVKFPRFFNSFVGEDLAYEWNIKHFSFFGVVTITIFVAILGILIRFFPWMLIFLIPDIAEDLDMIVSVIAVALLTSIVVKV